MANNRINSGWQFRYAPLPSGYAERSASDHITKDHVMDLWLTTEIFNWVVTKYASSLYQGSNWSRAYEIWAHAEEILQERCNEFHLVDIITTLRRAVDNRVKLLHSIYKFKKIPIKGIPSDLLETMQYVGIIRPVMLKKLIEIRNALEHKDATPPSQENCEVFLEFVWYFLKSTDKLVRESIDIFRLYPADSDINQYSVECTMGPLYGWSPVIGGWVPHHIISDKPKKDWLRIVERKQDSSSSFLPHLQESIELNGEPNEDQKKDLHANVVSFVGEVRGPAESLKRLIHLYFKIV